MGDRRDAVVTVLFLAVAVVTFVVLLLSNSAAMEAVSGNDEVRVDQGNLSFDFQTPDTDLAFEDVALDRGFDYRPTHHDEIPTWAGVYVADVDNDGDDDVLAVGGGEAMLFVNEGGEFRKQRVFEERNARAAHFFDYDADGDRDLLILYYGGVPGFYENTGGEFERTDVGLDRSLTIPYGAATADFTGNGRLDLFVYQFGEWNAADPLTKDEVRQVRERHPEVRPTTESGERNFLYRNDGGEFTDITDQVDGFDEHDWTYAASAVDFTGNGHPDLHVANDFTRDFIYVNQGNGRFDRRDMGPASDRNAMSSTVVDINRDQNPDVFVTNILFDEDHDRMDPGYFENYDLMTLPDGNNLFVNDGFGEFTDQAPDYGIDTGGWGWAAVFADLTNSGRQDLVHATTVDIPWEWPDEFEMMQTWIRDGETFTQVPASSLGIEGGLGTRGVAAVDYDADGALDLMAATTSGGFNPDERPHYRLYENRIDSSDAVQFYVRNPDGLARNAEVFVKTTDGETHYRLMNSKSDFLSQDSRMVHVGTGGAEVERVRVAWPGGAETVHTDVEAGSRYIVTPSGSEHVTTLSNEDP